MRTTTALRVLRGIAKAGKVGRLVGPKVALLGLPAPVETSRVRARVRQLLPILAVGRTDVYRELWESAAAAVGADVEMSVGGFMHISRNGVTTTVRENLVELDNPLTLEMAGDRVVAAELLVRAGLPVAEHLTFSSSDAAPALDFLRRHGRVVVKPARFTGAGTGVTCDIRTEGELVRAMLTALRHGHELVVERHLLGEEHRILVLDGSVVGCVKRSAPRVVGDGRSSIASLVVQENERRAAVGGRDGLFPLDLSLDAVLALRRQRLAPDSVVPKGQEVVVAGAVNSGASAQCVTASVSAALAADAVAAVQALRLRWASVELCVADPERGLASGGGIIEVNSTPGLTYHYQVRDRSTAQPVANAVLNTLLHTPSLARRRRTDRVGPLTVDASA